MIVFVYEEEEEGGRRQQAEFALLSVWEEEREWCLTNGDCFKKNMDGI